MPAHTNKRALNKACVIRWKVAILNNPNATQVIITPSCLRVDKAMIFLKSHSVVALRPAISIVIDAEINKMVLNRGSVVRNEEKRMSRKTPAVTSVEE